MPVMNGVEMAGVLKKTRPEIRILYLSSYDDFTFAKSAIDLNIDGYILKPINKTEIETSLRKVVDLCDRERERLLTCERLEKQLEASLPLLREEFFRQLLLSDINPDDRELRTRMEFLGVPAAGFKNAAVISMRFRPMSDDVSMRDSYIESMAIANVIRENNVGFNVELVRLTQTEYVQLCFFDIEETDECVGLALEYVMRVYDRLANSLRILAVFGVSEVSCGGKGFSLLLRHARQALENQFYSNGNPVNLFTEIEDEENDGDFFSLQELQSEIDEYVFLGDVADVDGFIDKYINRRQALGGELYFKGLSYSIVHILQLKLLQKGLSFNDVFDNEGILWNKLSSFETIVDLRQWLKNVIVSVQIIINENNKSRNAQLVNAIKLMIKDRYSEALTVTQIASAVYLSPKQANSIFRKAMGCSIFDYVVSVRMENAKELLKKTDEKVISVAERVGYSNKSHFALIFKRYTGMTPAQYKTAPNKQITGAK
jgi:two-component system response regulator YesN